MKNIIHIQNKTKIILTQYKIAKLHFLQSKINKKTFKILIFGTGYSTYYLYYL